MTREQRNTLTKIKIMNAYIEGKEIEQKAYGCWIPCKHPRWEWYQTEYRIKPNKLKKKEI